MSGCEGKILGLETMHSNVGLNRGWRKTKIGPIACYSEGREFLGEDYFTFLGIALVGGLISGLVPLVLLGPMMCGFTICLLKKSRGEPMVFDQLFKGFDYFVQSLIAVLCYMGITLVLMVPFLIALLGGIMMISLGDEAIVAVGVIIIALAYVGMFVLVLPFQLTIFFASALIVDRNMEGWPAFKLACQGTRGNFSQLLGCAVVGQLILMIAVMMCIVPIIFAMPIVFAGHFMAYQKIFGLVEKPVMADVVT